MRKVSYILLLISSISIAKKVEYEIEIPETLLQVEIRNLIEQTASRFAEQGMDVKSMFTPDLVKSLMESSQEEAKESLRRKFALQALAEEENINLVLLCLKPQ